MASRNLGTGLRDLGSKMTGFGLALLKQGMDRKRAKQADETFSQAKSWLDRQVETGEMTPEEAENTKTVMFTSVLKGMNKKNALQDGSGAETSSLAQLDPTQTGATFDEEKALPGAGNSVPLSLRNTLQEPLPETATPTPVAIEDVEADPKVSISQELKKDAVISEPTTLSETYQPFAKKLEKVNSVIASSEWQREKTKMIDAGVKMDAIIKMENDMRNSITETGKAAIDLKQGEKEFELKTEKLRLVGIQKIINEKNLTRMQKRDALFKQIADDKNQTRRYLARLKKELAEFKRTGRGRKELIELIETGVGIIGTLGDYIENDEIMSSSGGFLGIGSSLDVSAGPNTAAFQRIQKNIMAEVEGARNALGTGRNKKNKENKTTFKKTTTSAPIGNVEATAEPEVQKDISQMSASERKKALAEIYSK